MYNKVKSLKKRNTSNRGEVFTPPNLAEEMVELLREGLTEDGTILDPCAGATFVFPIFTMFLYCEKFGVEKISKFIKNLYVSDINIDALNYGQMILDRYIKITIDKGVNISKEHYKCNFDNIVDDYYNYCLMLNEEM